MDKANYDFNDVSKAFVEKLSPDKRAEYQNFEEHTGEMLNVLDTDHAQHREQRIAEREEFLTQHYEQQFNMPRPKGTPAPRVKQGSEIKAEARQHVDNAYIQARQEILIAQKAKEQEFLVKELGIEPPSRKSPDLDRG